MLSDDEEERTASNSEDKTGKLGEDADSIKLFDEREGNLNDSELECKLRMSKMPALYARSDRKINFSVAREPCAYLDLIPPLVKDSSFTFATTCRFLREKSFLLVSDLVSV